MARAKKAAREPVVPPAVVQLWYGEDQAMLELELKRWVEEFRKKHPSAAVVKLEYRKGGEDGLAQAFHGAAWGGGLFAERTLIVARGFLSAEARGALVSEVRSFCAAPPGGAVVLFVEGAKLGSTKSLVKYFRELTERGKVTQREFAPLNPLELEQWVVARARAEGGKLTPAVARTLVAHVGGNAQALAQEVAKLVAYRGAAEVQPQDVDRLVSRTVRDDVFAFLDAAGRRDLSLAGRLLQDQFSLGTSPQSLVGLLVWHLRVLASVRDYLDRTKGKLGARELAQELKLHPFVVTKALRQIPYYSRDRIAMLYRELAELDRQLKSTRTDPQALFTVFLGKLAVLSAVKEGDSTSPRAPYP